MADKTTEVTTEAQAPEGDNIQISLEQICASILKTLGSVEVSLEDLITDYSGKSIAVNQNEETKALTFSLVDVPVPVEENQAENE